MSWVKLDDGFPDHPKVVAAGEDAAWMYVAALCYCAKHGTDGFIPEAVLARLSTRRNRRELASKLIEVGLWDRADGGFLVHDFLDWQPSSAEVKERRKAGNERIRRWRETRKQPQSNDVTNAVTNADATPLVTPTPSRPVPSRPVQEDPPQPPEGGGRRWEPGKIEQPLEAWIAVVERVTGRRVHRDRKLFVVFAETLTTFASDVSPSEIVAWCEDRGRRFAECGAKQKFYAEVSAGRFLLWLKAREPDENGNPYEPITRAPPAPEWVPPYDTSDAARAESREGAARFLEAMGAKDAEQASDA